jgi:hypothetical protein
MNNNSTFMKSGKHTLKYGASFYWSDSVFRADVLKPLGLWTTQICVRCTTYEMSHVALLRLQVFAVGTWLRNTPFPASRIFLSLSARQEETAWAEADAGTTIITGMRNQKKLHSVKMRYFLTQTFCRRSCINSSLKERPWEGRGKVVPVQLANGQLSRTGVHRSVRTPSPFF